jgi:hypothetical protein
MKYKLVAPAQAGAQRLKPRQHWIPAFAGMTVTSYFIEPDQ